MPQASSYPIAGAIDSTSTVLGVVAGAVNQLEAGLLRSFVLPAGVVDVADYTAAAETQLVSADATTGFTGTGGHSGASVTLNTSIEAEGTGCVGFLMDMDVSGAPVFYYTFSSAQAIGGRTKIAFQFRYSSVGPSFTPALPQCLEAVVADGTVFTGNANTVALPSFPEDTWITVELPLDGLTEIKSVGVRRTVNTGVSLARADLYIDDIKFPAETKLDQARGSAASVGVIVGPTYSVEAAQKQLSLNAAKPVLDLRRVHGNVLHLHNFYIDETGATNVAAAISAVVNSAAPGQTVRFTPGGYYRFDHDIVISGVHNVTIDFTGATLFLTYQSNTPFVTIDDCHDIRILGGTFVGYGPTTHLGANMENIAGTPTDNGTGVELNAQNEEVQLLDSSDWDLPFHFARVLPHQIGVADDGLGLRNYFEVTLSDSAQVASDCVVTIYDGDTSTALETQTLTLTGTPTAYPVSYFPTDLGKRLRLTVKKSTATTNTITVAQVVSQGRVSYSSTYDIASAILISNSERIVFDGSWIESFGGDAIQISDANVRDLDIHRVTSRGCRRQGLSFNRGQDIRIYAPMVRETGRSGIDIEPFANTWFSKRVRIYDAQFFNITNYALAMGNWARVFDCVIDGVDVYDTRLGVISGGANRGVFKNMRNWSDTGLGMASDFHFAGSAMEISDLRTKVNVQLNTTTNTYDDGGGVVEFTPTNNVVRSDTVNVVAGFGVQWVSGYRPDTLIDVAVTASATSHAVVFAGYTIPSGAFGVRVETNWNSGFPYITAKTNAGFTINFPNAAPGDGSGRVTWSWYR